MHIYPLWKVLWISENLSYGYQKISEFLYSLRNPLTFADSGYKFCKFHLHLRIPVTFCESTYMCGIQITSYICLLGNPQQIKCADKICVTSICTRNPRKSCKWNPLTFWNLFKYLSPESRNTMTQNCAPIQCTVWPRIVAKSLVYLLIIASA